MFRSERPAKAALVVKGLIRMDWSYKLLSFTDDHSPKAINGHTNDIKL